MLRYEGRILGPGMDVSERLSEGKAQALMALRCEREYQLEAAFRCLHDQAWWRFAHGLEEAGAAVDFGRVQIMRTDEVRTGVVWSMTYALDGKAYLLALLRDGQAGLRLVR